MIEYIVNENNQTIIYQDDGKITKNVFNLTVVKQLCLTHLFTYDGYIKAVKKQLNYAYRIPVYIDEGLQLIATKGVRDYDNIWVNYASVTAINYVGNRVSVAFTSHRKIDLGLTRLAFSEQIKRLTVIKFHISKHFHG